MLLFLIISLACLFYGFKIKACETGTHYYVLWFFLSLFFSLLILAVYFSWWDKLPAALKIINIVFMFLVLFLFIILMVLILSKFKRKETDTFDYLIVLGSHVKKDGPSSILKYRLEIAESYLKQNSKTLCIVSGSQGSDEPFSEAFGMAYYLIKQGISSDRILLEDKSTNTYENISFSMKSFDLATKRIGIVTNNFHMFRALKIAKHLGIKNAEGLPAGSPSASLFHSMIYECGSIMKGLIKHELSI